MSSPSFPIENISDTALWVAYYRAMETERPDALFHDPYAKLLAGARGKEIVRGLRQGRSSSWAMIVRTKVLDEIIVQTIEKFGCDTVLNLAAGLDSRPYRLSLPASLHWIDVDLPAILSYKEQKLTNEQPKCSLELVKLDLADVSLRQKLFSRINSEAKQVLVITEGLLIYLTAEQVSSLAIDLHAQSTFRWWLTEFISPQVLRYMQRAWEKQLAAANTRMQFALENSEAFYQEHGWKLAEFRSAMEEGHRLKREMPFSWLFRFLTRLAPKERQELYRKMSGYALLERA